VWLRPLSPVDLIGPAGARGPAGTRSPAGADRSVGGGVAAPGPGPDLLRLDTFCIRTQLHPQLVHRLAVLGLLDLHVDSSGQSWLPVTGLARAARIERLRRDLGVTYAATGVVLDLLDRIDDLERHVRHHRRQPP
jgi:hypothetical protein